MSDMPDEIWAVTFYTYHDGRSSGAWYSNKQPDATEADVRYIRYDLHEGEGITMRDDSIEALLEEKADGFSGVTRSDIRRALAHIFALKAELLKAKEEAAMLLNDDEAAMLRRLCEENTELRAEVDQLRQALAEARKTMLSVRVFVMSRERIKHPEGVEWYDGQIAALTTDEKGEKDE